MSHKIILPLLVERVPAFSSSKRNPCSSAYSGVAATPLYDVFTRRARARRGRSVVWILCVSVLNCDRERLHECRHSARLDSRGRRLYRGWERRCGMLDSTSGHCGIPDAISILHLRQTAPWGWQMRC